MGYDSRSDDLFKKALEYIESAPEKEQLFIRAITVTDDQNIAIPMYEKILEKYPNEKLAYWEIGDIYYHDDMADRSIPYFEKCLEFDPTFEYAIQHLHMAFGDTYRNNDMIELSNRALALFPGVGNIKNANLMLIVRLGDLRNISNWQRNLKNLKNQTLILMKYLGKGLCILAIIKEHKNGS
ncbi:MAG: hypothetical protein Ct9H300mP9_2780 [Candidatus Neomarinimicrobiota bacterium]|nr:MAG: hypothetical protein Ct9H300mP9_2780 [Candidatus Neomarinimicrobiota bacterium]